jgi:hypothetical protein
MTIHSRLGALVLAASIGAWVAGSRPGAASAQPSHSIGDLAWLAGSWAGPDGNLHHEEHWTAPRGGAMVGMHRTIKGDRMAEFEFIRIEERDGVIIYLSMPNGRSPATLFPLKSLEGERVVFENPEHDFPQRIIYWKAGGSLRARIEGTSGGKATSMEWTWKPSALAP